VSLPVSRFTYHRADPASAFGIAAVLAAAVPGKDSRQLSDAD